jgi:hypothetical protein
MRHHRAVKHVGILGSEEDAKRWADIESLGHVGRAFASGNPRSVAILTKREERKRSLVADLSKETAWFQA